MLAQQLEQQIAELQCMVGRLTVENHRLRGQGTAVSAGKNKRSSPGERPALPPVGDSDRACRTMRHITP